MCKNHKFLGSRIFIKNLCKKILKTVLVNSVSNPLSPKNMEKIMKT